MSTEKNTSSDNNNNEVKAFVDDLKHFGYLLPTNDEELEEFEKIYGTTQVMLPQHLDNTDFLTKKSGGLSIASQKIEKANAQKESISKGTVRNIKNTYFKRLVLSAEIAYQLHQEPTFGHVKFVKIQYLCENVCCMRINTNYGRYAAGPLDPKHIHSADAEFKKRKWFTVTKTKYGFRYEPDENIEEYRGYFQGYFGDQLHEIEKIIQLFKKLKTDFCEIVATMFAVWKDLIEKEIPITTNNLKSHFYMWSKEKKRFSDTELEKAIVWMEEHNIVPVL